MDTKKSTSPKKISIIMDNFNSTANLTANPGFQSTITLGSKDVINEKDELYNPFDHRIIEHPNSTIGSLVHLLKSSLGSGILSMPAAFKNAGLIVGAFGTFIVGFICAHCVHILVKTSHDVCKIAKVPSMGFAETCGAAFEHGPKPLRRFAAFAKHFVDWTLVTTYIGAASVYVVLIADSFKQVLDKYYPEYELSVQTYCALQLLPLVLISQIRNLKWLVPFSAIANLFLIITFAITLYYMFQDVPNPSERNYGTTISQLPLFISTVIFAMEGIGVVMPVENEMKRPQYFLGCPGVLNTAMAIVVMLYTIVGFFGYLKYGNDVVGSVTLNLPVDDILAQIAKILIALAILFTYSLQYYVPMEIIWRKCGSKVPLRYHNLLQIVMRTSGVVLTVAVAAAVPNLELIISLVGSVFFSTLGLMIPAIAETVHLWERDLGYLKWIMYKNFLLLIFAFICLLSGSFYSMQSLLSSKNKH